MPDVYATITELPPAAVEQVAVAMELSATDPQHQEMVASYLSELEMPKRARVLEVGCGTGAIARIIAHRPGIETVVGIDPSPVLIAKAREIARDLTNVSFEEGDGSGLPIDDASFDAVVVHRVLSHVPNPEGVLAEAYRVIRPGGWLALFDGGYATITVATGAQDPLQACVAAFAPAYINDPWVVRRFPQMVADAGFADAQIRSHGYVQVAEPEYMLSIVARGADALVACGRVSAALGEALKAEARHRAATGTFFGHIAYASLTARKAS